MDLGEEDTTKETTVEESPTEESCIWDSSDKNPIEIESHGSYMSEAEKAALRAVDVLLDTLTNLGKDKPAVKQITLVPYQELAEGQVYHEKQKKAKTCFLTRKKNYLGFGRLNHFEQHILSLSLNTRVDR